MFQKSKPDFLALLFRLFSVVPYGLTKTTIRTHDALVDGMDYISKVVIKDREEYYSDYQTTFEDLMLLAFSSDKEQKAHCLTTLISLLSVETMQYVFEPAWSTNPTYLPHKRIEDINQRFRNKCGEYKFIIGNSDQNQMVHNLVLDHNLSYFVKTDNKYIQMFQKFLLHKSGRYVFHSLLFQYNLL